MEAALTFPISHPRVEVRGGSIHIDGLAVDDRTLAELVERRIEQGITGEDTVRDALEIGARVLDREDLSAEVDYVRAEFERAQSALREQLGERARELTGRLEQELDRVFGDEGGVMSKALEAHADELAEQVGRHFDPERQTAVQHQVREVVGRVMQDSREALLRHLSSEDGSNPLADFKSGVREYVGDAVRRQDVHAKALAEKLVALETQIVRLTEQSEAKRALSDAEAAGTRKGRSFEERVHEALERIAGWRGDCAHRVGDERGAGGTKKGDTVIEVGAADGPCKGRIVFEDKDDQLSKNKAWEELNGAMLERDADFAVLVVAGEENIPAGREQLVEYEGNKLIIAVDAEQPDALGLDLAYRYARLRVLMARDRSLEVDAAGVRDAAEAARSALKRAQSVRLALTNIDKSSAKARDGLDGIVTDVEAELERIEGLIAAAG